ncbi:cellulase family glycosylhydrolase [Nocardioides humilatus]|nr:cellulase family glycosylhydrolase [Nocardioides humilatus]
MSGQLAKKSLVRITAIALAVATLTAAGPGHDAAADPAPGSSVVNGLHVSGAYLLDGNSLAVQLRGADLMSSEYACSGGWGFVAGLDDAASRENVLDAMETWGINSVRVPLNSDCWFGTKPQLAGNPWVGAPYRTEMTTWINQITSRGMVAIADLHWAAPDGHLATGQSSMADADTSVQFWSELALEFGGDSNVVFDLFNEPYLNREFEEGASAPGSDITDIDSAWDCWANGCTATWYDASQSPTNQTYEVAGMQDLIDAVRNEGATNVLLISGLQYSQYFDRLSGSTLPVTDWMDNIAISFHAYPGNTCGLDDNPCRSDLVNVSTFHPLIVGEYGRSDCKTTGIDNFLDWADVYGISYLGWQWLPLDGVPCNNGGKYTLTDDAQTGAPSKTGLAVKNHYLERSWQDTTTQITTAFLPTGLAGTKYRTDLTAAGGTPKYKWSFAGGTLPPGLKLQSKGRLSGTLANPGSWVFYLQVTDNSTPVKFTDTQVFVFDVDPMFITTTSLFEGYVGQKYTTKLTAQGGKSARKWTVLTGALPAGLKLSSSGTLSGRPTTIGVHHFTVRLTDGTKPTANTATQDLEITINP